MGRIRGKSNSAPGTNYGCNRCKRRTGHCEVEIVGVLVQCGSRPQKINFMSGGRWGQLLVGLEKGGGEP